MSGSKIEPDCKSCCRSSIHGIQINSALSVRSSNEEAIAAYIRSMCCNYHQVIDTVGRSALHMAASCGCNKVAHWLLQHKDCNIDAKDAESGYTALHRALFYGQIHVAIILIQHGASLSSVDNDYFTPIEHVMLDRLPFVDFTLNSLCEVYVWGTNVNYTLGTGNQHNRELPELLEEFRKQNISIKQVAMHKFHSVFVSHNGQVYSCGHGQGGRLGLGTEQAVLTPRPMTTNLTSEICYVASISRDHTVLLMESGGVFTCGLNSYHQLGINPPPSQLISPTALPLRSIKAVETVTGICASKYHTVIWGPKALLTFGLHAGQLGHPKGSDKTIIKPRVVAAFNLKDCSISQVSSSDGAIVVVTDKGNIFLLHEYACRRIACRQMDVAKVVIVGGRLDPQIDKSVLIDHRGEQLQILLLTTAGKLLLWQESLPQFTRCVFTIHRLLLLRDVAMTHNQLLFVTRDGEAFTGDLMPSKKKKLSPNQNPKSPQNKRNGPLERNDYVVVRNVSKLAQIHRAVSITSEPKGRNFAVIQTHPKQALFEVPQLLTSTIREDMKNLLLEAHEDDSIHDVEFQLGHRNFPAHKFVITHQNDYLGKLIEEQGSNSGCKGITKVKIDDVKAEVFQQILQYIYTNECDMMAIGKCPIEAPEPNNLNSHNSGIQSKDESSLHYCVDVLTANSKDNKKSKKSKLPAPKSDIMNNNFDPIKIVQKTALKFQMPSLIKELDNFSFEGGFILPKNRVKKVSLQPKWNRQLLDELCDVIIRCENGRELKAHKCILSSRLEYFHSMLNQGWSETLNDINIVKLALPYDILEILIDFIYQDDVSPLIQDSEDIDLLSNLLVVADQLFVSRLKEQCEVSLINVLTLKNAAELLQLSDTYLAKQLKSCCMQYICLNLDTILENKSLEGINPEVLTELSRYYCELNPVLIKRVITPYSYAPGLETLDTAFETNPFIFNSNDYIIINENIGKKTLQVKRKPKSGKLSVRVRNESTSSIASDDANHAVKPLNFDDLLEKSLDKTVDNSTLYKENVDKNAQWVKITNNNRQQKIIQARMKAINASKEPAFIAEATCESFVKLTRNSQSPDSSIPSDTKAAVSLPIQIIQKDIKPIRSLTSMDFPELCSPPNNQQSSMSTFQRNDKGSLTNVEPKKIVKLSQKQRKRLTSVGDHVEVIGQSPPSPAWGFNLETNNSNYSLVDIIRQERKQVKVTPISPILAQNELAETPAGSSSPWAMIISQEITQNKLKSRNRFVEIVADEKKQKDNLTKMLAKPLELTQIEDKAISDLLQFYNAAGAIDERITVQRVDSGPIAVPTWITNH